jgi:hypothetical protein
VVAQCHLIPSNPNVTIVVLEHSVVLTFSLEVLLEAN